MTTCAEALARALRDAGVVRMFGLPGGEILAFIEAARQVGIEFVLTRDESTASFMADVTGQMERRPGVCVSTLGPGAVNLTLGVANAFLDRSPLVAVTASLARSALPYATHQNLDLNAVYRPFTKMTLTLDGLDTRAKVRRALRASLEPRMGPVHLALPSDVARAEEKVTGDVEDVDLEVPSPPPARREDIERTMDEIRRARRPVVIFGLDLDPRANRESTRRFAERLGVPVFVTPKAKGIFPEDHSLFHGVCAGVAADDVVVELFSQADLLIGLGFEPVESDKLWHHSLRLVNIGPLSIASGGFRPACELVGEVNHALRALGSAPLGPFEWSEGALAAYRRRLEDTLRPRKPPGPGVSPYELTLRLRELVPRETILVTDVGSIKSVTTQGWKTFEPLTFFESNGLSSMSYGFAGAMAAKLVSPEVPVLCTMGDGGFAMILSEIETCLRRRIHFPTVVFNDAALSLIRVSQESKGFPEYGVTYSPVDFAAVGRALGAWARRVVLMDEIDDAVREALAVDLPAVIDVLVDPTEYRAHYGLETSGD